MKVAETGVKAGISQYLSSLDQPISTRPFTVNRRNCLEATFGLAVKKRAEKLLNNQKALVLRVSPTVF